MTVLWNSADKTANVTLSGGSLIAALTSSSYGGVRADTSTATGKIYCEYIVLSSLVNNMAVGWANATASLTTLIGADQNSVSWFYPFGQVWKNGSSVGSAEVPSRATSTLCVAFDINNLKIWVRVNGSFWNASSTADPATGVGGFSLAAMNAGPYFPAFNSNISGASVEANFGATSFGYAVPSGFSGLDTNVQAFNASSKFLGYDVLSAPDTSVEASKFLGYDVLSAPDTSVEASKFLGYAVILDLPIFTKIENSPKRRLQKYRSDSLGSNLSLLAPAVDTPFTPIIQSRPPPRIFPRSEILGSPRVLLLQRDDMFVYLIF